MRPSLVIVLSALTVGAAACAGTPGTPGAPSPVLASAPSPVEDYDWFLYEDGDDARLSYGLAESDDLRLGLDCHKGAGRLTLSAVAPPGSPAEIYLESGGDTERFAAKAEPSEVSEGVFLSAKARTDLPVFQRFRRLGWLALWRDDERQAYAPHPGSADRVERFFAFCG
jgi:hypothetical protein